EQPVKNPAATAAEDFAEDVERVVEPAAGGLAAARPERRVAELVVGGAFLRVGEDLIGFAEFLEAFLGGMVALVFVGMIFDGQFAVGLFELLVGSVAGQAEHLVVIAFG